MIEKNFPSTNSLPQEIDLHPTRDDDPHTSVWHRPPVRSKCELSQISSSPSPIKRPHHRHRHHSFRPVVLTEQTTNNHHQPSAIYPSTALQSSYDSTLTQVTSIMINESTYPTRNEQHHVDVIDQSHQQQGR